MSGLATCIPEDALPLELTVAQAVEAAYPAELERARRAVLSGLSVLVECDKEVVPYLYRALRDRLKRDQIACHYLDGRPREEDAGGALPMGIVATTIQQLTHVVRGAVERKVVVLPHLDLLTTGSGALTGEAREVIPLLYENPELLCVGFKDPSFPLPEAVSRLFPHAEHLLGVARDRLRHLVTQREARKLGRGLDPYLLYKHLSGTNPVRMRRLLRSLEGEDYPQTPDHATAQLRRGTLASALSLPDLDLDRDIGGYARVKDRIRREILELLKSVDALDDPARIAQVEQLIPRGIIFWGPPGTGKTLFAKAIAAALGAAVQVVSGPELKSKWVGESEHNLRQTFLRARQSAPALIIFDELDSFASARGTYLSSGVEHSMVNQLLTEMDGFRSDELVFVVGTTNLVEALDPALLRPGRFELHVEVPVPDAQDRREILAIYDARHALGLAGATLDYAVRRTRGAVEGTHGRYTGDHLEALCRALARRRLRDGITTPATPADVDQAIVEYRERADLNPRERRVVATHEAGHAVCALHCPNAPPIDEVSIRGDLAGALGHVAYTEPANRYIVTRDDLLARICILYGGREAENLLLGDVSIGAAQDIEVATRMARALVGELGFGGDGLGVERFARTPGDGDDNQPAPLADATKEHIDREVRALLCGERARARQILEEQRPSLEALRDLLLERELVERAALEPFAPAGPARAEESDSPPASQVTV